jgi:tetratricopeptide (TPR) repeat protein
MIAPMSKLIPLALALCCLGAVGCSADPDLRADDWEQNYDRVHKATASGDHDQAIAVAKAFLKKYPDNVDGHLMVAGALADAAKAASDHQRPARFTEAVPHYTRVLELTRNPMWRLLATLGLIDAHDVQGLNNPTEATRYARMLITDDPKNFNSYVRLLEFLKAGKKHDEMLALLSEAKGAIEPSGDNYASYAGWVHDLVGFTPDFPRDKARTLLPDAVALIDQSLAKYGRTVKLVRVKGMLLREQAEIEPDPARQSALEAESRKTFDELDRLEK